MGRGARFRLRRCKALAAMRFGEIRRGQWGLVEDIWVLRTESAPAGPFLPEGGGWEAIRVAGGADIDALTARGYDMGALYPGLRHGAEGWADAFLIFHHRRLAHMSQATACPDNPNVYAPLRGLIAKGAVMVGPCVTPPEFRGKGLYAMALRRIAAEALAAGLGPVLIAVRIENTPSVKGVIKGGFAPFVVYRRSAWGPAEHFQAREWPAEIVADLKRSLA